MHEKCNEQKIVLDTSCTYLYLKCTWTLRQNIRLFWEDRFVPLWTHFSKISQFVFNERIVKLVSKTVFTRSQTCLKIWDNLETWEELSWSCLNCGLGCHAFWGLVLPIESLILWCYRAQGCNSLCSSPCYRVNILTI